MTPPRILTLLLLAFLSTNTNAQQPAELPDFRLGEPKDLNGHFPFKVPATLDDWEQRAEKLRQQILVSNGLWPLPEKTPLNTVIHGLVKRDGFTVEKVYFESVPNHFVTGLLFRPTSPKPTAGYPAVLCPHGHGGRLQDHELAGVRQEIVNGFERFQSSGRFPALARCAQLARMGCVTFIYDMIGYGDSNQIPFDVAHRAAKQRPEMEGTDQWGFYSVTAELRLQSIMGLQTWNSIRGLDFLESLPDVDASRMSVTGNSGGGTQTILLCAIDPRPIAAFPNGMVSTSMQGGCYCENCSVLRVNTGNVELAALFAPRPQAMTSVDDWTKDMMTDGYPQLQALYAMYGKAENVLCRSLPHFPHNYNYVTRGLMYKFFNRHMGLGLPAPIIEEDYELLTPEEYTVWNDEHPVPQSGPDYERRLLKQMADASDAQLAKLKAENPDDFQKVLTVAYQTLVGNEIPHGEKVRFIDKPTEFTIALSSLGYLETGKSGQRVPAIAGNLSAKSNPSEVKLYVTDNGVRGLDKMADITAEMKELEDNGNGVIAIDLFGTGESRVPEMGEYAQRWIDDDRHYAAFDYGYNPTTFARRVDDVMTAIHFVKQNFPDAKTTIVATGDTTAVAKVAHFLLDGKNDNLELIEDEFQFSELTSYRDANFLPGAIKYKLSVKN